MGLFKKKKKILLLTDRLESMLIRAIKQNQNNVHKKGRKCTDIAIMAKHNGCLAIMRQAGDVIGTYMRGSTKIKDRPMANKYIQHAIQ